MSRRARGCTVGPETGDWEAQHRDGSAAGAQLTLAEGRIRFFDALGPMRDDATLADSIRLTRKSGLALVSSKGKLPFGAMPKVKHQYTYTGSRMQVTTDWHFPRGTEVRDSFSIGSCELQAPPARWRPILAGAEGLEFGEWQAWPEDSLSVSDEAVALTLEFADGATLELGHGEDLWRWHGWEERPADGIWQLVGAGRPMVRRVVAAAETLAPRPRTWRFSWYAAWSANEVKPVPVPSGKLAVWWSDGSLDTAYLKRSSAIELNLSKMEVPAELCRHGGEVPCLSSSGVQRRLRHAVRQIRELTATEVPVIFSGWSPGACDLGRHVDRKGELRHWDWPSACEFFAWARNALGPERPLFFASDTELQTWDLFELLDLGEELLAVDELPS